VIFYYDIIIPVKTFKRFVMKVKSLFFAASLALTSLHANDPKVVDLTLLYSQGALNYAGSQAAMEDKINHIATVANDALENTQSNIRINIAQHKLTDRASLDDSTKSNSTIIRELINEDVIKTENDLYKTDILMVLRPYMNDGYCGIASILDEPEKDFSKDYAGTVINFSTSCRNSTPIHELGHLFGLRHSYKQDPTYSGYGIGYGEQNSHVTLMPYPTYYGVNNRQLIFSTPEFLFDGKTVGVEATQANIDNKTAADARQMLMTNAAVIADYRVREDDNTTEPETPTNPELETAKQAYEDALAAYTASIDALSALKTQVYATYATYLLDRANYIASYQTFSTTYRNFRSGTVSYSQLYSAYISFINRRSAYINTRSQLISEIGQYNDLLSNHNNVVYPAALAAKRAYEALLNA
jgi:hypothetical protein